MKSVRTDSAPAAIGPYSQGVVANGLVFVSGQIPIDPETGKMTAGGVGDQTRRVLQSLGAVLEAAGSSLDRVVRTTVYMTDLGRFGEMNGAYEDAFGSHRPARVAVQVAALPKGSQVEIDAIAVAG